MTETGPRSNSIEVGSPRVLAFYLPQFHPIPENDRWWGPGFTDWRNVAKAKPLFPGHYQPHTPADLGYYDLRLPEVRERQVEMARSYGIDGFCYYHYWFGGRRLLERPFAEVLASGSPVFPFALCWANEAWTRNWDSKTGHVLMPQAYSPQDDLAHIRWLVEAFADDRYVKIDGRPLMLVYRARELPDSRRTTDLWRQEAQRFGFPDLYLAKVESHDDFDDPRQRGFDANVGFMPRRAPRVSGHHEGFRSHIVLDYESAVAFDASADPVPYRRFPAVMCSWDNTSRRKRLATVYANSSPAAYERWLRNAVESVSTVRAEENLLFVIAWNEWAEGNHLEPDERYGYSWLEATRRALGRGGEEFRNGGSQPPPATESKSGTSFAYIYNYSPDSAIGHAVSLVNDTVERERLVVDLGAGGGVVSRPLTDLGFGYHGLELHPEALVHLEKSNVPATRCDLSDVDQVIDTLDVLGEIGAFLMLDVIEHLLEPQRLLVRLSQWALSHGGPHLIVSVPNVAHVDVGTRLLLGRWDPTETGLLDSTHIRFFTAETLERMLSRCGWRIGDRSDFEVLRSDQFSEELRDELPESVVGALDILSSHYNPLANVQQFVWVLGPTPVERPPETFLEAIGPEQGAVRTVGDATAGRKALDDYLTSVGVLSGEMNRRLVEEVVKLRARLARSSLRTAVDPEMSQDSAFGAALDDLAQVYAERPDLQAAFQPGDVMDLNGLLEWVLAAGPADPDARRLAVHRPAVSRALLASAARELWLDMSLRDGLAPIDSPRLRQGLEVLTAIYASRPDLRATFSGEHGVDRAGLLRWAVEADPGKDLEAAQLRDFSDTLAEALATVDSAEPAAEVGP